MRYLLDTNIICDATKPVPSQALVDWLADQVDTDLFISTLSLAEIHRGIREKVAGKKRRELEEWFAGAEGPQELFRGRILAFDERAALAWGRLMAEGTRTGRPRSSFDMLIAAIAQVNDCVLVSDNEKHFIGVKLLNPLRNH
jgi:predicted nucleic acid-binding protein